MSLRFERQLHISCVIRVFRIAMKVMFCKKRSKGDIAFHPDMFVVMLEDHRYFHQLV